MLQTLDPPLTALDPYLNAFSAQNPRFLAQTPRAHLWRVETAEGPGVLKLLTPRGIAAGERIGAKALRRWNGNGAVKLLAEHDHAQLLDWLPGPALVDMVRRGQESEAAHIIAATSLKLHRSACDGFLPLKGHYRAALTKAKLSDFPIPLRATFARAQTLWHSLLATTTTQILLHGDLHHDNILHSGSEWCAIDPKGLIGDPAYEFAVAFRTPVDSCLPPPTPDKLRALAGIIARRTALNHTRLLQFGFAHVALSLAFHNTRGGMDATDLKTLMVFDALGLPQVAAVD